MAKNKLHKFERVKHLSNVTLSLSGESKAPVSYPWHAARYHGMKRILELGCGKGEHSLAFAADNPQGLYVGVDSKSHRICVGAEKANAAGLENIHFLRARVEDIGEFFEARSIHEIWLTFPDPHLKKRRIKHRLSSPSFLEVYRHLLVPQGRVMIKTDSDILYSYTRESVALFGGQIVAETDNTDRTGFFTSCAGDMVSAFEKAARSKGNIIKYMSFTLN